MEEIRKAQAAPEGTISKDGTKVKHQGKWIWNRKDKNINTRDLRPGQNFTFQDDYGYQHKHTYSIDKIDGDTIHYSFVSETGVATRGSMNKKEFISQVGSKFLHSAPKQLQVNPKHLSEDQKVYVDQALSDGSIRKDLDFDNLPETIQKHLIDVVKTKKTPYALLEPSPKNIKLFQETGLIDRFKDGTTRTEKNGDVEIFSPDKGFAPIEKLSQGDTLHKLSLPELKKLLLLRPELKATVDPKMWKATPMPVYGGKHAFLGDYVKVYTSTAANPYKTNNVSEDYRIVKQFVNKKGEKTWLLKDSKGETRAIVDRLLDDKIALNTDKKNSLIS